MKIRSVRAHPFGPVADDELSFGSGFTVVHGPNESGKSSWHAATTTALTGQRKGRARKAEKLFADRHRPWQHDGWAVSCVLDLDDGRSVRLLHNLARGTAKAIDDVTGANITDEFDNAGSVDAAQLIGLDRDTLPLVASVRQAEILQLAAAAASDDNVSALRGFLQQSVSSRAATDSTAEVALDRLARFAAEAIGTEKRGSAKPLRLAREAVEAADAAVTASSSAWDAHHSMQVELDEVESQSQLIAQRILHARLAEAEQSVADAEVELAAARSLEVQATSPAASVAEAAELDAVREALLIYERQPLAVGSVRPSRVVRRSGGADAASTAGEPADEQTIGELRSQLVALPASPSGDVEPRRAIVELSGAVRSASAALAAHVDARPGTSGDSAAGQHNPDQLRSFATELAAELPPAPSEFAHQSAELDGSFDATAGSGRSSMARLFVTAGLLLCFGALAATIIGSLSTAAIALFAVGAVLAIAGGFVLSQPHRPSAEVIAARADHDAELRLVAAARDDALTRRSQLVAELSDRHLPADPEALRSLATQADRVAVEADALAVWNQRRRHLAAQTDETVQHLAEQLLVAGVGALDAGHPLDATTVGAAADQYVADCQRRSAQARRAASRPGLEARLQSLIEAEERQVAARQQQRAAESALRTAALAVSLGGPEAAISDVAGQARNWLHAQKQGLVAAQQARQAAARLDGLLAGRTIAELAQAVDIARSQLDEHRQRIGAHGLSSARTPPGGTSDLRRLESQAAIHTDRASELRGRLAEAASALVPRAEVLEHQQRAGTEYERLQRLDGLVRHATAFLEQAREHLHRDIAPGIAEATKHRLATVSAGRYKEIRVNPDDLSVQVQLPDGGWRLAERLSHGTAEQVYLLVRAAIAEIVAPDVESCPLILDDVTVHADHERTIAMLETLEELSVDRQVILFSQELDVIEWAEHAGVGIVRLPAA